MREHFVKALLKSIEKKLADPNTWFQVGNKLKLVVILLDVINSYMKQFRALEHKC